jgi:hypothetical protein
VLPQGGSCRGVVHALHSVLRRFVFKQGRDVAQSGSAPEWGRLGRIRPPDTLRGIVAFEAGGGLSSFQRGMRGRRRQA